MEPFIENLTQLQHYFPKGTVKQIIIELADHFNLHKYDVLKTLL